jgi:hypothetical protein
MKRQSGWQPGRDRRKEAKSNGSPQNRRAYAVEVGLKRQCQIETRARHLRERKQSLNNLIAHIGEAVIRHVKSKN